MAASAEWQADCYSVLKDASEQGPSCISVRAGDGSARFDREPAPKSEKGSLRRSLKRMMPKSKAPNPKPEALNPNQQLGGCAGAIAVRWSGARLEKGS